MPFNCELVNCPRDKCAVRAYSYRLHSSGLALTASIFIARAARNSNGAADHISIVLSPARNCDAPECPYCPFFRTSHIEARARRLDRLSQTKTDQLFKRNSIHMNKLYYNRNTSNARYVFR